MRGASNKMKIPNYKNGNPSISSKRLEGWLGPGQTGLAQQEDENAVMR
jgi:hypothetical protein